jgi:tetratricopeptide (TPR) repeat protein
MRRRQAIGEAEGYLDLALGLADQWPLPAKLRDQLAERAISALARVSGTPGAQAHVLYLTGLAYRIMERYEEALGPLRASADLDPRSVPVWLALGWCYKRVRRLDEAIRALEHALVVGQGEAIVHYNLACYWSLAGRPEQAIPYLAQSFDLDPRYRELVAGEVDFDSIRDLPDFQAVLGVTA